MINESGQTDKLLTWPAFSAPAFSSKKTNSILPLFHFEPWIRIADSYILLDKCLTLMVTFKFFLWMHFQMFLQLTCVGKCKATFYFFTASHQNECSNSSIKIWSITSPNQCEITLITLVWYFSSVPFNSHWSSNGLDRHLHGHCYIYMTFHHSVPFCVPSYRFPNQM